MTETPFRSKELSWLAFNSRVLQEAADNSVPLLERLRFLGIYSSNLDEFFRVRVATLKRLSGLGKLYKKLDIPDPTDTLHQINQFLQTESKNFNAIYKKIILELRKEKILIVDNTNIPTEFKPHLRTYFAERVKQYIMPVMVKSAFDLIGLKDQPMYLAVRLTRKTVRCRPAHALIEIPSDVIPRFHVLPEHKGKNLVIYLEDIIRFNLDEVFHALRYDKFESYAIKFTRDAEIEFEDDITESLYHKMTEALRSREHGHPVRLNYDANISANFLRLLKRKLNISGDDTLYPGARYHNRRDLMDFPTFPNKKLYFPKLQPIQHHRLKPQNTPSIFKKIRKNDTLLHYPYHTFSHFLDYLREAITDPFVRSIKLTQYRIARDSCISKALINAVRSGKEVTIFVEPAARFDEKNNISWANKYQNAGIHVVLGIPSLKVHAKMCLVERRERGRSALYTSISTGNFHEGTAKAYCDHMLLTANQEIGRDVETLFNFFEKPYRPPKLEHLLCSPFTLRAEISHLIQNEIDNAKHGLEATIDLKLNNLSDPEIINHLYRASQAGVTIRLIVRSMFSIITQQPDISTNISAISIVDRYLEHSRIFRFHNAGNPKHFISSADFLPRNFDSRIEIVTPIFDKKICSQFDKVFELQWADNQKARVLDANLTNKIQKKDTDLCAQTALREYIANLG